MTTSQRPLSWIFQCAASKPPPPKTALANRCWLLRRETKNSGRAGGLCCVCDHDISREESAATLIAGVVKVNVSPVPPCSACDRHMRRRKLIHDLHPVGANAKHTALRKGCTSRNIAYLYVRTSQHCGSSTALGAKIGPIPGDHSAPTVLRQFVDSDVDKRRGAGL
jgi:hypothetical protein